MSTRSERRKARDVRNVKRKADLLERLQKKQRKHFYQSLDEQIQELDVPLPTTFNHLITLEHKKRKETVDVLSFFLLYDLVKIIMSYFFPIPNALDTSLSMWKRPTDDRLFYHVSVRI